MAQSRGVVVVTGAGSGIGWASAKALAGEGYTVIGGVLSEAEADMVGDLDVAGVTPQVLDVTSPQQIEAAAELAGSMAERFGGLRAVVNNAGIAVAGPLEFIEDEDLRRQFDVNVFGLMSVTRAMLPLLRQDKGRVINIGSVAGRLTIPFTGPYCASKFAVRALSDSLRAELRTTGVDISLIEPGPIDTPIWERSLQAGEERLQRLSPRALELYGAAIERVRTLTRQTAASAIGVEHVVEAVVHAVTAPAPRAQYLIGNNARLQAWVSHLPGPVRDVLLLRRLGLPSRKG